ncbi:Esterase/lipase superfamily enzyme [bacterium A37T11]|nr:Esterase/lipase superfamily enzyme [bacterium A37T11]
MEREYYKAYSNSLGREMELLVFGYRGRAVLFFPTRMAHFYDYEDWGLVAAVEDRIDRGELQLFCVDSVDADSFYNAKIHPSERIKRYLHYEQYILEEVIPLIRSKNNSGFLEVAGCSMGAYHAANIALKHPLLFNKMVCMSGRFDLTRQILTFKDLFEGFFNDDIYFNTPRRFMANLQDEAILSAIRRMEIIIAVGETDPFLPDNREFSQILKDKAIDHQLIVWEGFAHRPRYWQQMLRLYL